MKTQGLSVGQPTSDFLENLAPKDREALAGFGHHREYRKAASMFRVGDPRAHVNFLESGRVKIYQPDLTRIGKCSCRISMDGIVARHQRGYAIFSERNEACDDLGVEAVLRIHDGQVAHHAWGERNPDQLA